MKSKKTDNKKFAEKIICICGRRFSYVGGLTYHKKVSNNFTEHNDNFTANFFLFQNSGNAAKI